MELRHLAAILWLRGESAVGTYSNAGYLQDLYVTDYIVRQGTGDS
jgi:hypothetical protein